MTDYTKYLLFYNTRCVLLLSICCSTIHAVYCCYQFVVLQYTLCIVAIVDCTHVGSATASFGLSNQTVAVLVEDQLQPPSVNRLFSYFIQQIQINSTWTSYIASLNNTACVLA